MTADGRSVLLTLVQTHTPVLKFRITVADGDGHNLPEVRKAARLGGEWQGVLAVSEPRLPAAGGGFDRNAASDGGAARSQVAGIAPELLDRLPTSVWISRPS